MVRRINLALQGGGAHGAYTWGVLDRLLEEEDLEIAAISGTSAGAMNGAALKAGWVRGGREGARAALDDFWADMGGMRDTGLLGWVMSGIPAPALHQIGLAAEYSLVGPALDMLSLVSTPYASGPFYTNPLRAIVEKLNFDEVCHAQGPALYVNATKVRNGKIRVFEGAEVTPDALLASACLPTVFRAVEFFDAQTDRVEAFWDGGYSGNPALFPLFRPDYPDDIVIVALNPLERDEVPMLPDRIQNRMNEISFNTSLLRELRAIEYVKRLIAAGVVSSNEKKDVLIHLIADDEVMLDLSSATKMFPYCGLLEGLKQAGRASAEAFLSAHGDDLGKRSSVDMAAMFG
ncbi:patatin-like phospholipase family protein [Pseudooceanicola sp. CBS1P-1]|uniref:Patatin-like phospholipase family protein n=1 Tax=Pseudooceanicola albus TaxID=2692189 RepID=A0A6L7G1H5_9RHOB|nr:MULTISPECIES: patatin-like phospholipase family protein [Pseudooceanicola]MBT9383244.1 patatin-like phospholipase family protein [Pseudooceanicola endophyticus]MXN16433.1 patatin-like phospholipase family protein [Pseudooceanicola albus]